MPGLHKELPFEKDDPNAHEWTARAYELLVSGEMTCEIKDVDGVEWAEVDGPCPRCNFRMTIVELLSAVAGAGVAGLGGDEDEEPSAYISITISCPCTEGHKGRPDGVKEGCGINFLIEKSVG